MFRPFVHNTAATVLSSAVAFTSLLSFQPLSAQAVTPKSGDLPYGRYTCKQGYVWREAVQNDVVCVRPKVRDRAHYDNAHAAQRIQPGGGAYGPDTCKQGYVWREAIPSDHVCVTPKVRTETATENREASKHRVIP